MERYGIKVVGSLHGHFFELIELGNNCYCLRGLTEEKRTMILTAGPWQLAGSFLSIRKWIPNFRADRDKIESAITWVRILNLPVEFFRVSVINKLATCIGDPIKIDGNTFTEKKGRFARFCVEVKTNKPLELGLHICGKVYQVVYENLPSLCLGCGKIGHTIRECKKNSPIPIPVVENSSAPEGAQPVLTTPEIQLDTDSSWLVEKARNKEYGEWMVVERKKKIAPAIGRKPRDYSGSQSRNQQGPSNKPTVQKPTFVNGPGPRATIQKTQAEIRQNKRVLPKNLNQKGKEKAHSASAPRQTARGISIKEPSSMNNFSNNPFSVLPSDKVIEDLSLASDNGREHENQPGGPRNQFPERKHGCELDPKSSNPNTSASVPRALSDITNHPRRTGGECHDNILNSVGNRGSLTHTNMGGQRPDRLAEICAERIGTSSSELIDIRSSHTDDCEMAGAGY